MNMPVFEDGTVHFTTTLFALVRESLQIKMTLSEQMDVKDEDLRKIICKLWPLQAKKMLNTEGIEFSLLDLLLPPRNDLIEGRLTVGKIYGGLIIVENWRMSKNPKLQVSASHFIILFRIL